MRGNAPPEILELVKRRLEAEGARLGYLGTGVQLTGGSSLLKGIDRLAEEVFNLPVHVTHAKTMSGITSAFENPQFSTAIGLTKYAQAMQGGVRRGGFFKKLVRRLTSFGMW